MQTTCLYQDIREFASLNFGPAIQDLARPSLRGASAVAATRDAINYSTQPWAAERTIASVPLTEEPYSQVYKLREHYAFVTLQSLSHGVGCYSVGPKEPVEAC